MSRRTCVKTESSSHSTFFVETRRRSQKREEMMKKNGKNNGLYIRRLLTIKVKRDDGGLCCELSEKESLNIFPPEKMSSGYIKRIYTLRV